MLRTQETLDGEIIVDSFAGGGRCGSEPTGVCHAREN
nr:MAG TPA: hypothetical protein [Caudoviricetes sp.]